MTTFSLVETMRGGSCHVLSCSITMSQKELHCLVVVQKIHDRRLSVVQAAEMLGLSRSQVHRLVQAYDRSGAAGLISKKRQQPSNRRHSEEFRNAALDLIRELYLDFGPTLPRISASARRRCANG
jgi:predicted transcriptional regulator